jgi:ferredoxin/flavodoxin---NADP+ reductase
MITWQAGSVVKKQQWHDDLYTITIKTDLLPFKAGQFANIGIESVDGLVYRPYSLVNTPTNDLLEVHFNTVSSGRFSPLLAQLDVDSPISVANRAGGLLTLDQVPEERSELWFCATGTGIGPFISILRGDEVWQRFNKIIVCYATKTASEMAYYDELNNLKMQHPEQFRFAPFITREKIKDTVNSRFTTHLKSKKLEPFVDTAIDVNSSHFMLCGSSAMINDMTELLEQRGLRRHSRQEPGHIAIEKYF